MNDEPATSFHLRSDQPARMTGNGIHVGCSGWVYRHWKGGFYPAELAQKRWFHRYAESFDTVEINASFYRLPLPSTFDGWREKAPPGFRYAVKVNRFITHNKKLAGVEEPLAEFIALARMLGPALGPLLHQLPPSLHRNDERLAAYLALLPTDIEHVVEFRHRSWYVEAVLALLDRHGVGFVTHDLVGLVSPRWASGRTAYVRFHGTGGKYRGRYSETQMKDWADWLNEQRAVGRSAWAYFNNDIGGDAIEDARVLRAAMA
ncbi:MAG: DUF72 domain-containing protein [Sphingomicrobium sp.]|nr:DUF72 domain-containing protein [Sphingomonadales bacterium]